MQFVTACASILVFMSIWITLLCHVSSFFCMTSKVDCQMPPALAHGWVKRYGHVATYTCQYGHGLVGVPQRTCLGNGSWFGEPPTCVQRKSPAIL